MRRHLHSVWHIFTISGSWSPLSPAWLWPPLFLSLQPRRLLSPLRSAPSTRRHSLASLPLPSSKRCVSELSENQRACWKMELVKAHCGVGSLTSLRLRPAPCSTPRCCVAPPRPRSHASLPPPFSPAPSSSLQNRSSPSPTPSPGLTCPRTPAKWTTLLRTAAPLTWSRVAPARLSRQRCVFDVVVAACSSRRTGCWVLSGA